MDIRKLKTLDDAIEINEIQRDKPYHLVVIKASIELALYEHHSPEVWNALTEESKRTHKEQLKEYFKTYILELVAKELKTRLGVSVFEIKGEPVKYTYIDEKTYLAILSEEQLVYLRERYDPVLRDIK